VTFNEPMDWTSTTDPFNYTINGNTIACNYGLIGLDLLTVQIPLCNPVPPGEQILTVWNVVDLSGNFAAEQQITIPAAITCVPAANCGTNVFGLRGQPGCSGSNLQIYIGDSCDGPCGGAGFLAGPFAPGTVVRLSRSNCPSGAQFFKLLSDQCETNTIAAHVMTKGDPVIVVTDSSGATACSLCPLRP
jgi:hypothetical protein